jgi:hypothetical protein
MLSEMLYKLDYRTWAVLPVSRMATRFQPDGRVEPTAKCTKHRAADAEMARGLVVEDRLLPGHSQLD